MSKVNNIHEYKKALVIAKDLKAVAGILDQFLRDLVPYMKYSLVANAYRMANDSHMWAKLYITDQEKIIASKGSEGFDE